MTDTRQVTLQLTDEEIVGVIQAVGVTGYLLGKYMDEIMQTDEPLARLYLERASAQRESLLRLLNKLQLSTTDRSPDTILQ